MPTWKKKDEAGGMHFLHLCGDCHLGLEVVLRREGWTFLRGGEPVACSECARKCRLTAEGLWGAGDDIRYQVCGACSDYAGCALKGRYYC
jgi:hypothetical protein